MIFEEDGFGILLELARELLFFEIICFGLVLFCKLGMPDFVVGIYVFVLSSLEGRLLSLLTSSDYYAGYIDTSLLDLVFLWNPDPIFELNLVKRVD